MHSCGLLPLLMDLAAVLRGTKILADPVDRARHYLFPLEDGKRLKVAQARSHGLNSGPDYDSIITA